MRNRFIIGAGNDTGTGYLPNVTEFGSGLFRPGDHGGQGMHQLTITEMPKHNHSFSAIYGTSWASGWLGWGNSEVMNTYTSNTAIGNTGGDQPHMIMPPYYSLAYIMKL